MLQAGPIGPRSFQVEPFSWLGGPPGTQRGSLACEAATSRKHIHLQSFRGRKRPLEDPDFSLVTPSWIPVLGNRTIHLGGFELRQDQETKTKSDPLPQSPGLHLSPPCHHVASSLPHEEAPISILFRNHTYLVFIICSLICVNRFLVFFLKSLNWQVFIQETQNRDTIKRRLTFFPLCKVKFFLRA